MGKYANEAKLARKLTNEKLGRLPSRITLTEEQLANLCVTNEEKRDVTEWIDKINIAKTTEEKKNTIMENSAKLGDIAIKLLDLLV